MYLYKLASLIPSLHCYCRCSSDYCDTVWVYPSPQWAEGTVNVTSMNTLVQTVATISLYHTLSNLILWLGVTRHLHGEGNKPNQYRLSNDHFTGLFTCLPCRWILACEVQEVSVPGSFFIVQSMSHSQYVSKELWTILVATLFFSICRKVWDH